jgi:hypothetical protein
VNQVKSNSARGIRRAAAILLLQVNLVAGDSFIDFSAGCTAQQSQSDPWLKRPPSRRRPDPSPHCCTPEAPATAAPDNRDTAPPTLAQQMQQAQQQSFAPPQPFHVPMPHSHNPLAPYIPAPRLSWT